MFNSIRLFHLLLAFIVALQVEAQPGIAGLQVAKSSSSATGRYLKEENPLFKDEAVLHFKLTVNYQELLKDRGDERQYHKATLAYTDTTGKDIEVDLKVMVRGNHRRDPKICRFPPLMLNFARKTTPNTVFEEVNKVKMVTHCLSDDYVLREYLVYKVYNILTDKSFRVRLCQVDYIDLNSKRKTESRYAFLIEDDDEMAKRNNSKVVSKKLPIGMEETESSAMALLAVFQYMIGNTDWSVPYRHNIKLIATDSLSAPTPVPYDFDYSGIVSPPYAVPPPQLGISTVRQRLFRGYGFTDQEYQAVINTFKSHRSAIYYTYRGCDLLEKSTRKQTLKYLNSFYKVIDNPKDFRNKIVRVGQQNQRNYVSVKGLK